MRPAALALVLLLAAPAAATGLPSWPAYAGGPRRLFFNPAESIITAANVAGLRVKWTFPTGAIVTASPAVVTLDLPGEGRTPTAFIASWDDGLYALRVRDGTALWRFAMADQPGAAYPDASSAAVETVDGRARVFVGSGESLHAVDAITGSEVWRFDAGTGCRTPPGDCGFGGLAPETNEIESSPIVAGGEVLFGMDINENGIDGKGGFFALDVHDGRLLWYFDVETGATCRTLPGDVVHRFDGYHSESDLGLPAGFFATRPGCDFDRTTSGCGGVWSSASVDLVRGLLFFGTSACEQGTNTAPYEEAIVALGLDGTPAWRWKPRPSDPADLDFGAAPNLFTITAGGAAHDVVGEGGKDGTYYAIDRDGVNAVTGARWDDPDPSALPYWRTKVVPGDGQGGIIATAAVDEAARRVYFSTAPGVDLLNPQRPTVHALDADTGAIVWENTAEPNADASYAPTSAIPGVVFVGKDLGGALRAYDARTGALLASVPVGFTLASAPAVVDGTAILGGGAGERTGDPSDPADAAAHVPQPVTALCAAGTPGCDPAPGDRCDAGGSAPADARALAAVRAAAETACPCAAFDGAPGRRHPDYVRCARRALDRAVAAGQLRPRCRASAEHALVQSTCGRPGAVVCCETRPDVRCLVVPAAACAPSGARERTSCAPAASCAATTCLAAGVCAAGS
ncbi:MAG TPA: PQQ-binding-like beta-propeller repeat protein [Candidatus Binatia bacterium]|nr:PQQ-binding-like beta-propeller repeat protein [Candidatus Binatia bacterium]